PRDRSEGNHSRLLLSSSFAALLRPRPWYARHSPDRRPFDCRLALQLEAQFDEERLDGVEIVDNDEDVVHPFKRHLLPSLASLLMPEPTEIERSLGRTSCQYRRAGSERVNARKPLRRLSRLTRGDRLARTGSASAGSTSSQ